MVTSGDYDRREVEACRSVLVELAHVLGGFRDHIVVIGGWVPALLFPAAEVPHVGSLDIDLALDFRRIPDVAYKTILTALRAGGFVQDHGQPFRFYRTASGPEKSEMTVEIDLMAGEYGGTGRGRRTQRVQDVRARKARGCDLAFEDSVLVSIEGVWPDGAKDKVTFRVAGLVPFLVMKGMALHDRKKEKDAYDIWYCIDRYAGRLETLAGAFAPFMKNSLAREGLGKIRVAFASIDHIGPKWVADFLQASDREEREIIIRRAFEATKAFLDLLEIEAWRG